MTPVPLQQPHVLVLLGCYLPAYKAGGPIRSVGNLVAALGGELHFKIVTRDRDLGDKSPFLGVVTNRWVRVGDADVMYLRPGISGFLLLYAMLRSADSNTVVYLNSFFSRRFSMLAVLLCWLNICRPRSLVLAPRGEFSPGAVRFKHIRKGLYITICRWFGVYQGLIWHASSEFEAADIRRHFPLSTSVAVAGATPGLDPKNNLSRTSHVAIASDLSGITTPTELKRQAKMPDQLHVVFVSRLSRMKNLAGALRMLNGVSGDVAFDICGPTEDEAYWHECQELIATLPANIRVRYLGKIAHDDIGKVFAEHDLFLFPTLGENFGHVIAEALLTGCPVLTSDQTAWRGLEALGVGWDLPLSAPERFREVLQQCVAMGPIEHAAMCGRAAGFGKSRANSPAVVEENRALFRLAIGVPTQSNPLVYS